MTKPLASALQIVVLALVAFAVPAASAQEKQSKPIAVGEMAPDFTLEDQNKSSVKLSAARGRPVVLVFYRGYW